MKETYIRPQLGIYIPTERYGIMAGYSITAKEDEETEYANSRDMLPYDDNEIVWGCNWKLPDDIWDE